MNTSNKSENSRRRVTYYDVSPYAALSANATTSNNIKGFSEVRKLFTENMNFRSMQTCEHNYTILDGTHYAFSNNTNIALWGNELSLSNRLLPSNVVLDVRFGGLQSSRGMSFSFDAANNGYSDMLNVKWYKDNTLLSEATVYPDSAAYSYEHPVEFYNRVVITFNRLNKAGRYLKVEAVYFGAVRVFGDGELESLTINEGVDPTGRTIYISSASFTINTKDSVQYMFQKRQPVKIAYTNSSLTDLSQPMGTYYIDRSRKHANGRYTVEAVDKIGVLDSGDEYMGGIYNSVTAEAVVEAIVGGIFDVEIDDELKNIPINGWIPIMKRREALAQVALAIGAIIDATRTDSIKIRKMTSAVSRTIGKSEVYQSSSVEVEFPCTGVEVIEHNFVTGRTSKDLHKDTFTGERLVKFSEPVSNLTIENGVILMSGANYAMIQGVGTDETLLSGRPYIDNQNSVTVRTEQIVEGTQERVEKIDKGYLINRAISQSVAQRLYEYYLRQNAFDGDYKMAANNPDRIGDIVKISTVFGAPVLGQIEKLTLYLGWENIKARGIVRGN